MFTAHLLPGHGFQPFTIYKQGQAITKTGRPQKKPPAETDDIILGALISANQKEIDQWKQNGHPITHKIIEYSACFKAKPTDSLVAEDGRIFYVQGRKNPGDLHVTMIYYVEERLDTNKAIDR